MRLYPAPILVLRREVLQQNNPDPTDGGNQAAQSGQSPGDRHPAELRRADEDPEREQEERTYRARDSDVARHLSRRSCFGRLFGTRNPRLLLIFAALVFASASGLPSSTIFSLIASYCG